MSKAIVSVDLCEGSSYARYDTLRYFQDLVSGMGLKTNRPESVLSVMQYN